MIYRFIAFFTLFYFCNCSSYQLKEYDGFWNWMIGRPGYTNTLHGDKKPRTGVILDNRHPYYLWFRTPEIIFNPQGGIYFPEMIVSFEGKFYYTNNLSEVNDEYSRLMIIRKRNKVFLLMNAGLIEYVLPYRTILDKDARMFDYIILPFMLPVALSARIIVYVSHDVIKTVMIPVAGVYYTVQAFEDDEEEE